MISPPIVGQAIQRDAVGDRWVKVLALYPRNELLKDQFAEVYSQARRLDATLADRGRRKILIGTFFGPTPYTAEKAHEARSGWRATADGSATPDEDAMPIAQALRAFAPGRVSRRYGISHEFERHWICPALDQDREAQGGDAGAALGGIPSGAS
ncbi:hypothetical protein [Sedimentitalea todarodis]|uniref:Uncharacterized protein n=1 Tax=Sedimentitalea todarodis TaxID=1631240 RepID=A0ABU3VM59_9RHOB|nr:hypothetical protein [Sedimentitalea todarodis]MDU9006764.1 hypothetical protein [Sedimentitalea todarodis]